MAVKVAWSELGMLDALKVSCCRLESQMVGEAFRFHTPPVCRYSRAAG